MFRTTRTARIAIATASLAAAFALPSAASADTMSLSAQAACTEAHDTSAPTFNVSLCGVSDVDQFRTGLASNGNSFCGPAALFNVLNGMYNRQGVPVAADGLGMAFANPANSGMYANTTAFIDALATYAGGSEDGTKSTENREAFKQATTYAASQGWNLTTGGIDTMNTPEFGLAIAERLDKAPVQMWYGRYVWDDNGPSLKRTGGHLVTVVAAKGTTGTGEVELLLHDPGRAADHGVGTYLKTQSAARLEKVTLTKVTFDEYINGAHQTRTRWELKGENYIGSTRQMVEGINWFSATK